MTENIQEMSVLNNAIRPIYGPSSSHTFAPARLAFFCRRIFGELDGNVKARIYFLGGDTLAFQGHLSDLAVIGGILEYNPYGTTFREEVESLNWKINGNIVHINQFPNIEFEFYIFPGYSINDKAAFQLIIELSNERKMVTVKGASLGGGDVDYDIRVNGEIPPENVVTEIHQPGYPILDNNLKQFETDFFNIKPTFQSLLEKAEKKSINLHEFALEREHKLLGVEKKRLIDDMQKIWSIMKRNITDGLTKNHFGELSEDIAENLDKLSDYQSNEHKFMAKTCAFAISVMLIGASMGRIISGPTAGAAGIVPAIAYSLFQKENFNKDFENKIINSLFTAGLICLIIKSRVSVSGAQHGCSAECGTGRAMASALETAILNGTNIQIINAAALSIKNTLGIPCDPIGGLVEIPCIKRNGIYSVGAHIDSILSLCNLKSLIDPDDVLEVMKEVGEDLNDKYKEGKIGTFGLANTKSSRALFDKNLSRSKRFQIRYRNIDRLTNLIPFLFIIRRFNPFP